MPRRHHRAQLGLRLGAAADPEAGQPLREHLGEGLGKGSLDMEDVRRGAGLAPVAHLRGDRALDGGGQVGVGEDDERRLAAQLEARAQHPTGREAEQVAAHCGRAGEGELPQAGVGEQAVGRAVLRRDHHVQDPGGRPGLVEDRRQREGRQRGLGRRPQHGRAAGGERRADASGGDGEREVPGSHDQAGTRGAARHHDAGGAARVAAYRPLHPHGLLGRPLQVLGREGHLLARLGQGLPHLEGDQRREPLGVSLQRAGRPAEDAGAVARGGRRPCRPRRSSRRQRLVCVRSAGIGDAAEGLAGRGVLHRQRPTRAGWAAAAADRQLLRARGHGAPLDQRRGRRAPLHEREGHVSAPAGPARW